MKFYDTDLASDVPEDIHSDREPPKDLIQKRKVVKKLPTLKVSKEIWRVLKHFN
jgi:hypothetical protein